MALRKLPCEYPEIRKARWKACFGDLSESDQIKLMDRISKICDICKV